MRGLISAFTILAFIATVFPAISHAAMNHGNDHADKIAMHGDCHHDGKQKTASDGSGHQEKQSTGEKPCCDKGVCKCASGSCHSSAKIFAANLVTFHFLKSEEKHFRVSRQTAPAGMHQRIIRPPNA